VQKPLDILVKVPGSLLSSDISDLYGAGKWFKFWLCVSFPEGGLMSSMWMVRLVTTGHPF
jgi:hypothetical protein